MTQTAPAEPDPSIPLASQAEGTPSGGAPDASGGSLRVWGIRLLKLVVLLLTGGAILLHLRDAFSELTTESLSLHLGWLGCAAALYAAGLLFFGIPFSLAVRDAGCRVPFFQTVRVYVISHLGKYVPGKAMAIVIRGLMLGPRGVSPAAATATSFYETFATMASGSVLAALLVWFSPLPESAQPTLVVLRWPAAGLALGFGTAILPPVFRLASGLAARVLPPKVAAKLRLAVRWRTFLAAVVTGSLAWGLWGACYLLTIAAVGGDVFGEPAAVIAELLALSTAVVALSVVGGFLSMIPGQAFVRELILIEASRGVVGQPVAVAASLLFRLLTLVVEGSLAGLLYLGGRR